MRESTATTTQRRKAPAPAGDARRYPTRGANALAPQRVPVNDAEPSRQRLQVAPPVPVSAPRAPFVVLVLFVVVTGVLGILVLNTKITENAFRLAHLQHQQDGLDEREQQLDQQLADDKSPTNVAAKGRAQGLVSVGQPAFMTLPNGAVVGVPQPALGVPDAVGQQAAQQSSAASSGASSGASSAAGQPSASSSAPGR
jgi:hypothetical protein